MEENEIAVLIVEDQQVLKQIIKEHFAKDKVTYAQYFPEEKREKVLQALDLIESFPSPLTVHN